MKFLNRGYKPGFLTGLGAFITAKIAHYAITFALGFTIAFVFTLFGDPVPMGMIKAIDHPFVGLVFLTAATIYIYREFKKKPKK